MSKIGFIGLGIMGKPMAKNLMKAGYELKVFDVMTKNMEETTAAGAESSKSIQEVAEACTTIITMLPNSPQVKSVCLEAGGIIHYAKPGTLVIDMSSIAPGASQDIAAELKKKGIRMVDAPVSGGEPKAIDGTLAIMVGGSQADYEEAKPMFEVMGATYLLVGDVGSGKHLQTDKSSNRCPEHCCPERRHDACQKGRHRSGKSV